MTPPARRYAIAVALVFWVVSYFGARAWISTLEFGSSWTYAAALLPTIPFAALVWSAIWAIRSSDELERRIHLEALALAFPLTMLMLMVLGLLELGLDLNRANWSYRHLWAFLPLFYAAGLVLARRSYGQ